LGTATFSTTWPPRFILSLALLAVSVRSSARWHPLPVLKLKWPGLGLVRTLAKRDNVLVFAGARKPSSELEALAAERPDKVKILKLTSGDEADNKAAVAEIERVAGRLDVVIANAGIGFLSGPVLEATAQDMAEHFAVNTIGTLVLFQATYPLLKVSSDAAKFIPISGLGGSIVIGGKMGLPTLALNVSKAALNYLTVKIRADHDSLSASTLLRDLGDNMLVS
jgi:NAD(P)-dependent dehydrogenase (short-subunit alcohol dehydrogenase family)